MSATLLNEDGIHTRDRQRQKRTRREGQLGRWGVHARRGCRVESQCRGRPAARAARARGSARQVPHGHYHSGNGRHAEDGPKVSIATRVGGGGSLREGCLMHIARQAVRCASTACSQHPPPLLHLFRATEVIISSSRPSTTIQGPGSAMRDRHRADERGLQVPDSAPGRRRKSFPLMCLTETPWALSPRK